VRGGRDFTSLLSGYTLVKKESLMKKALIVGINDYPGTSNDLAGCVNDTANLKSLLVEKFGFDSSEIRTLTNSTATRIAIMTELEDLVSAASAGDVLVFHFSGHGSQVPDQDDDEKADRMDEILCPRDFSWDGCWIRDDDLSEIFSRLPNDVHLEVLLDCCHSGTGTREIAVGKPTSAVSAGIAMSTRERARIARVRYLPPPPAMAARIATALRRLPEAGKIGTLVKAKPRGLNHVLWAACTSAQYSADAEISGSPNGAFSWFFCDEARKAAGKSTRAKLLENLRKSLRADEFDQTPQLECRKLARDGRVFMRTPGVD
jgi:hypothetical protein